MQKSRCIGLLCIAALSNHVFAASPPKDADYVFINGNIYTQDDGSPKVEAIAIKGNEIVFIGDSSSAKKIQSKNKTIDLQGKMLIPGFVESHLHPTMAVITEGVDLQTDDQQELLNRIKSYADNNPDKKIITGFGWRYNVFPDKNPDKSLLDSVVSDRPVFLLAIDSHTGWANTKALAMLGINKNTPDPQPPFSIYERDKEGNPTGYIIESTALMECMNKIATFDKKRIKTPLKEMMKKFSAAGITTVFDAGAILLPTQQESYDVYKEMEIDGTLSVRVSGSYFYDGKFKGNPIQETINLRKQNSTNLVNVNTLKIMLDGGDVQHTAAMLKGYADTPGHKVNTTVPLDKLKEIINNANENDINTLCHCYGDGAVRTYLDAIEANSKSRNMSRHTISHAIYIDNADLKRVAKNNTPVQFSAQWAVPDPLNLGMSIKALGYDTVSTKFMRLKSVLDHGGRIAFGTDWPAAGYYSTYKPLEAIQVAVTREMIEGTGRSIRKVMPPENEIITLSQALRASTIDAAYALGEDKQLGSLVVGKKADLVILEKDLFTIPKNEISNVGVFMTFMDGKLTYKKVGGL